MTFTSFLDWRLGTPSASCRLCPSTATARRVVKQKGEIVSEGDALHGIVRLAGMEELPRDKDLCATLARLQAAVL